MWKLVDIIPREFLCEKLCHARELHDLWELCSVAKRVWKPEEIGVLTKVFLEEALSVW